MAAQAFAAGDDAIEAFAAKWDRPGFGVYYCIGTLREGSTSRRREDIAALPELPVDIDLKDIVEPEGEVVRRLRNLPLAPTWVRHSGGGFYVGYTLHEPIEASDPAAFEHAAALLKRLSACLSGDPAPTHPAALLRLPGTHNYKRGEPVLCREIFGSGQPVDVTEVEALVEPLPPDGLFERRLKPKANGHAPGGAAAKPRLARAEGPVDVEQRLAAMRWQGPEDSSIHMTQLHCIGARLRQGIPLDDAVAEVLDATRKCVAGDPKAAGWNWRKEEFAVERMGLDLVCKSPELAPCLPERQWQQYQATLPKLAPGERPTTSINAAGPHFRRPDAPRKEEHLGGAARSATDRTEQRTSAGFVLHPFVPFDLAALPPRQWLYGRHYQRRTVSATIAPGGFGKTTLDLVEFVAMATCRNLLGEQPAERLRCWYHNGEDSLEELNRRLGAICLHYGIPQEELQGWFFMTSGNEVPLRVANGYSNLRIDEPLVARITAEIERNQIDLAGFDPLVTLHNVPERDPGAMDTVVRIFAGIADAGGCGVELAHHTRKLAAGVADYTVDDIRGASSIRDAVRAARMLNQMTVGDADDLGIPEHERASYFRVDRVKGNNSPAAKAVWRKFVNVELPNTDDVGVVIPWDYPRQGETTPERARADQKAEHVFLQLLDRYALNSRNVSANPGPTYAPSKFADEREAKTARVSKAMLKEAMTRLLASGRIRSEATRGGHSAHRLVAWQGDPRK